MEAETVTEGRRRVAAELAAAAESEAIAAVLIVRVLSVKCNRLL